MATIDLRTETVGVVPAKGVRSVVTLEALIDASKVSGNLVSGNTYNYLSIPAGFVLESAQIVVKTADGAAGTSTLTDGTIVPLAAQVMNAKGAFAGVTNLPKWYETGGILSGLIATANITTAIFKVIARGYMEIGD